MKLCQPVLAVRFSETHSTCKHRNSEILKSKLKPTARSHGHKIMVHSQAKIKVNIMSSRDKKHMLRLINMLTSNTHKHNDSYTKTG